ncbi:MAG TPA: tRNA lysidine(34) synthetase TilS [Deltaproteobacteria bacterium]|nr:tRNA lysidine(34) synthetase TilS [Deltaproteobacteria bacterium]
MLEAHLRDEFDRLGIRQGRILVAVSGGRDSMVLLDLVARCRRDLGLSLVVGHVDHGLRGVASAADRAHVREAAERMGAAFRVRSIAPETGRSVPSSRDRPTLEEAARTLRRAALLDMAGNDDCRWIATAHHAGDQAETLLMRLLRGTGPDGLAGMAPRSADGRWLKPLLRVLPERISAWAEEEGIAWREDESNQDRRFTRNRLRLDWIPGLEATFNPQLLRTLGDLAEAGRQDLEWIEGLVDEAVGERVELGTSGVRFAIGGWDEIPEALARRVVRRVLIEVGLGRHVSRIHLERILAFLRRGRAAGRDKRLELPRGFVLRRRGDGFELSAPED